VAELFATAADPGPSWQYQFTVFTPTYNRGHTLPRVYESLRAQTFRAFEWLIVDDGSTDGTAELAATWKNQAPFPVRYFFHENAGKHVAFNRGVREAWGELFLGVDSDDALVPEALERFLFHWNAIPSAQRAQFSAVTALCKDQHGNRIGTRFPFDPTDSDSLEMQYRYKDKGDKCGFQRTEVLRRFPFPEMPGCAFMPESIVWHKIAKEYHARFVNEELQIVFLGGVDQLSKRPARRVAAGRKCYYLQVLNEEQDWFWHAPLTFLKAALQFARYSFLSQETAAAQWQQLVNLPAKFLWAMGILPGAVLAQMDRWKNT